MNWVMAARAGATIRGGLRALGVVLALLVLLPACAAPRNEPVAEAGTGSTSGPSDGGSGGADAGGATPGEETRPDAAADGPTGRRDAPVPPEPSPPEPPPPAPSIDAQEPPACGAGMCRQGSVCVASNSPRACGPGCSACPAPPADGVAICRADGVCDYQCAGGAKCDGACYACCSSADCDVEPTSQTGSCLDHICQYACKSGFLPCGPGRSCRAFDQDFESGGIGGWTVTQAEGPFAAPRVTTELAHGGSRSLAVTITNGSGRLVFSKPLCEGAVGDLGARSVSFWVQWRGQPFPAGDVGSGCELGVLHEGAPYHYQASPRVLVPMGGWQQVVGTRQSGPILRAVVDCYVNATWSGTLYFDDFQVR